MPGRWVALAVIFAAHLSRLWDHANQLLSWEGPAPTFEALIAAGSPASDVAFWVMLGAVVIAWSVEGVRQTRTRGGLASTAGVIAGILALILAFDVLTGLRLLSGTSLLAGLAIPYSLFALGALEEPTAARVKVILDAAKLAAEPTRRLERAGPRPAAVTTERVAPSPLYHPVK